MFGKLMKKHNTIPREMGVEDVIEAWRLHRLDKIEASLSAPSDYALDTGMKQGRNSESSRETRKIEHEKFVQEKIAEMNRNGIDYRIEYLYNENGDASRFIVPMGKKREDKTSDTKGQRCKYCGCLVSSFDTHCSSCSAPI